MDYNNFDKVIKERYQNQCQPKPNSEIRTGIGAKPAGDDVWEIN